MNSEFLGTIVGTLIYWGVAIGATVAILYLPIKRSIRYIFAGLIAAGFIGNSVYHYLQLTGQLKSQPTPFQLAKARFDERCKSAGEHIYRTADNVEGVLLMKVRPGGDTFNKLGFDPMWPEAGMAYEGANESYIQSFLTEQEIDYKAKITTKGYKWVEVLEPVQANSQTMVRYRYTREVDPKESLKWSMPKYFLKKQITNAPPAKYGVTYDNMLNPDDRQYWVAGAKVQIIDLSNNQVMAERVNYEFDAELGNPSNRTPWYQTYPCLKQKAATTGGETRVFTNQILKPSTIQTSTSKGASK